jgi:Xaa-Pro aminopeptidase
MKEYELQAIIEFSMIREGAEYESFPSIIGSGPNSLIPHYDDNRRTMQKGDVVVMDVGAEVDGYAADVTRTIPVSGRFTEGQREVYSAVLRTQQAVIGVIRPGLPWVALDRKAKEILQPHGFAPYLTHSVSHHVGLDVHDIGQMDTLKAGMVITVEPGVYVPAADTIVAEKYRGFGIRIEDDVLVTENGSLVLSRNIPKEIGDIEGLMKR